MSMNPPHPDCLVKEGELFGGWVVLAKKESKGGGIHVTSLT